MATLSERDPKRAAIADITDPRLPKYGGPTARDSSVRQPPEAEEKTHPTP
jgi:hypothetical protein